MKIKQNIILIAGPTASGKTSHAIRLAQENDAVIINTDSMQVYSDLQILTARPDKQELASAPHFLFGHVDGFKPYSVAGWLADVSQLMELDEIAAGSIIFVGGTGLYFNALLEGLSPVPDIAPQIRGKWRGLGRTQSGEILHSHLTAIDPKMAYHLDPSDRQRIVRALEVMEGTGRSLSYWQAKEGKPVLNLHTEIRKILLMPERSLLHERINMRFDQMVEEGALQEVEALLERKLPDNVSIMKAIGVPQFRDYLTGEVSLEEAIEKAKTATRQYAKRQCTWFNNSFGEGWEVL